MTNVFISVAGQNDNLGDSVLRRGLVTAARADDETSLHIHVANNDADYLSAVGLREHDTLYSSSTAWQKAIDNSLLRERTVIGFNSGEVQVDRSRANLGWRAFGRVNAARLRGGAGFHTGIGVRSPGHGAPRAYTATLKSCRLVSWRDEQSKQTVGLGQVSADWAFGEGLQGPSTSERSRLVVSMRGDRPMPDQGWLDGVRLFAERENFDLVAFSQVVRDNDRTSELARRLGSTNAPILWNNGSSHADWESRARHLYRSTAAVLSDRLHALVIGFTEGAMPIGLTVGSAEKLQRTLGPAGFSFAAAQSAGLTATEAAKAAQAIYARRSELPDARKRAAESVAGLTNQIRRIVRSDRA